MRKCREIAKHSIQIIIKHSTNVGYYFCKSFHFHVNSYLIQMSLLPPCVTLHLLKPECDREISYSRSTQERVPKSAWGQRGSQRISCVIYYPHPHPPKKSPLRSLKKKKKALLGSDKQENWSPEMIDSLNVGQLFTELAMLPHLRAGVQVSWDPVHEFCHKFVWAHDTNLGIKWLYQIIRRDAIYPVLFSVC